MLKWLKFLPLELRNLSDVGDVSGPYFSKMRPLKFAMNDSELHMQAPPASYAWIRGRGLYGGGVIRNRNNFFSARLQPFNGFRPTERWGYNSFFHRSWMLFGPWFSGPKARLFASAQYVGPYGDHQAQNQDYEDTSFFHPNVFENALADYLRSRFGQSDDSSHKNYRAPVAWRRLQISPQLQAACFDLEDRTAHTHSHSVKRVIAFPIADDRFVILEFRYSEHVKEPFFQQLDDLAQRIIETIRLELSPQIIAKLDELKASGVDTNLSEHFAPLNWHTDEEPGEEPLQRIGRD